MPQKREYSGSSDEVDASGRSIISDKTSGADSDSSHGTDRSSAADRSSRGVGQQSTPRLGQARDRSQSEGVAAARPSSQAPMALPSVKKSNSSNSVSSDGVTTVDRSIGGSSRGSLMCGESLGSHESQESLQGSGDRLALVGVRSDRNSDRKLREERKRDKEREQRRVY